MVTEKLTDRKFWIWSVVISVHVGLKKNKEGNPVSHDIIEVPEVGVTTPVK